MKIALFADYHEGDRVWPLLEDALEDERLDLIVFTGDILEDEEREETWLEAKASGKAPKKAGEDADTDGVIAELAYREFFVNLTGFGVPVLVVPGHIDSPTSTLNQIIEGFPQVYNVQEKPFEINGYTFTGRGGAIGPVDADEMFYCSKEKTFAKNLGKGYDEPDKTILLVHTPPVSRVDIDPSTNEHLGSQVINDFLEKTKPAYCFCGHAHGSPGQENIADTIVVNPGPMFKGRYALVDLENHRVKFPTPLKV